MLTVICWKWRGWRGDTYKAEHVHGLQAMLRKHLEVPHRFICITDNARGLKCETLPLWDMKPGFDREARHVPNCYRRMRVFDMPELGERVLSIDLDCIIRGDITDLIPPTGTGFKILAGYSAPYNGSMWYVEPGRYPEVWQDLTQPAADHAQDTVTNRNGDRAYGSDQVWLSHKLPGAPTWSESDGIYQYVRNGIPDDARIVFFAGSAKPWDAETIEAWRDQAH